MPTEIETGNKAREPGQDANCPVSANWSLGRLLGMHKEERINMWHTLPAVSLDELQGHFMGFAPSPGEQVPQPEANEFSDENSALGRWLGKAFLKTGPNAGEGYNRCRFPGGKIRFIGRFTTEVGPSLIDGKPSLLMYYGSYHAGAPGMVDEIRKVEEYVYFGVGSTLDEEGNRDLDHFVLLGPTDAWVGGARGELVPDYVKPTR